MTEETKDFICPKCGSNWMHKRGFTETTKRQRYKCSSCGFRTVDPTIANRQVEMRDNVPEAKRYIITAAQNATPIHKELWKSLLNCAKHYKAELIVIPGRYKNPTSQWTEGNESHEWWTAEVSEYLIDGSINLGDYLTVLGNVKVQWAAMNPLASMETLTKDKSGIIGHGRLALRSVASPQHKNPKMMFTTGCVTIPNYTDTKQGKIAEFNHSFGGLIVEIADDRFHIRQLCAMQNGSFCDLNFEFTPTGVRKAKRPMALTMGDTHWAHIDPDVYKATFKSMIPVLNPHHLIWHDLLDQYAKNRHHIKDWIKRYEIMAKKQDNVEIEVKEALVAVVNNTPAVTQSVIVSSNHDRALRRWLVDNDPRRDTVNMGFYFKLSGMMLAEMQTKGSMTDPFILYGRSYLEEHENIRFLDPDESFVLCGVEHTLHGDLGPNGSRGTTRNLSRLGIKVTKGHNHTAEIVDGCYSVGKSTGRLDYESGPSSHTNTHCLQYYNGKRTLITIINGHWRL